MDKRKDREKRSKGEMDNNNGCLDNRTSKLPKKGARFGFNINKAVNELSMSQKIYTDWANHYLEKARSKRYISDLQQDVTDGVLLADVIEAVTNEKLQDIKLKPKNSTQMIENINSCLTFLVNLGVNIDGITAKDIRDGNLKAILGLFFSLSRHKQQQKTQQQQQKSQLQQQQQKQEQRHLQSHQGETTNDNHNKNSNLTNGDDAQSRLPSYNKQQGSKCPTIVHPSSKDTGQGRSKSQGQGSKVKQQNIQNSSSQQSTAGTNGSSSLDPPSSSTQRATSPAGSGIPTPGGRSLGPRSQSATPDKQSGRSSQSSTPTPTSQKSSIPTQQNKNSMLEKFKLFNAKEKSKGRTGAGKSSSKTNSTGSTSTSTLSTSSRSDTSSSFSARSSSSADAGPSSSATSNDPDSPKTSKPRPIVGGVNSTKPENIRGLTIGHQQSRQTSPSPYSSSLPATPTSSLPVSASKRGGKSKQTGDYAASRIQQSGSQTFTKGAKGGSSLIPKSGSKAQKSSSTLSLTSASPGSQIPTQSSSVPVPGSSIPAPGSIASSAPNSSIPKGPQSSGKTSSKSSKDEKMRSTGGSSKEQGGSSSGLNPTGQQQQTQSLPRKSKSHFPSQSQQQQQQQHLQYQQQHLQYQQQQQQQQQSKSSQNTSQGHHSHNSTSSSPAPPVPPHRNGSQLSGDHSNNNSLTRQHGSKSQSKTQNTSAMDANSPKTRYTEIEYTDGKIERVGEGHFAKPTNQAVPSSQTDNRGHFGHPYLITSQSVNVVKPTCSSPLATKSESKAQTSVSIVHNRSAQPPPLPKTEPPPSSRTTVNQNNTNSQTTRAQNLVNNKTINTNIPPQSPVKKDHLSPKPQDSLETSHSTSSSSNDSVILNTSATNSPRLGVKVLGSQTNRPANNIAIVQPHHGEKKETTFDTEVRTDVINKGDSDSLIKDKLKSQSQKETTFSEKKTTFIADSGETLDIQPMQPIKSMHYAPGFMRGYASPGKPMPISVSQNTCYAMTGVSPNRIGMNRSLMEANKFYSGSIKRATSSGSGNVSFDEYNSDYENYDYISGYMSDGDILKGGNKGDDMSSGYMSEGGASLYARRLQQRFREGMQAVKECMHKNNAGGDEDSFDDSSSISSGDISDTINEISTDEGNLTGGSGHDGNPYSSLKRGPKDLFRNLTNANLHAASPGGGKRVPNLGTSVFMGSDYNSDVAKVGDVPQVSGWRKYSLQNNRLLSSDPADYAYLYSGYEQWRAGSGNSGNVPQENIASLRKLSNASQPDIHYRSQSTSGDYAGHEKGYPNTKCDSETNTDQSHVYESNVRKMQNIQNARAMQQGGVGYGYHRRPLSNTSTGSVGSTKSAPGGPSGSPGGSPVPKPGTNNVGTRLAKHGLDQIAQQYHNATSKQRQEQSMAALTGKVNTRDSNGNSVPEYSSASLERRSKSSSAAQTEMDMFKSNSLGRRKPGMGPMVHQSAENGNFCASTIISNPHATYSKPDGSRHNSPYSSVHIPGGVPGYTGNYVPLEFAMGSPRNSANSGNWVRTNSGAVTADGRQIYHHVSDSESMDALSSASSINARIQQARALSGASARILAHSQGYGLQRSNSMKSESAYANPQNLQQTGEDLPSPPPPTSPTPSNSSHSSRFTYPMGSYGSSPAINPALQQQMVRSNTSSSLPYGNPLALSKINRDEDDSLHGSSLSLVSSTSSVYSTAEEKQNHEIRKLRRELESAYEKVTTLSTQLNTNQPYANCQYMAGGKYKAHVVAAFEQSLSNMTSRLQHLTSTSEQKDSELNELRQTIEALKRQSGLSIQSDVPLSNGSQSGRRHTTPGMLGKDLGSHHAQGGRVFHTLPMPTEGTRITRQISSDSMSSINSMSSACSFTSQQSAATDGDSSKKKKKKGWLRGSFSKHFISKKKNRNGSLSDCEQDTNSLRSTLSVPNSPLLQVHMHNGMLIKGSHSSGALSEGEDSVTCMELRKQLRDKDMKLTDTRLEALSSAHQLEQLREAMNKMKNDMCALKSDNDRLNRMVHTSPQSLNNSQTSLIHHNRTSSESIERTISLTENTSLADLLIQESGEREGRRVPITVYLGSNPNPNRARVDKAAEVPIGSLAVSGKTKWDILDNIIRKIFKEYVLRIDPVTNLGLSAESVFSYHIGDIVRTKDCEVPELLPIGYLVGDTMQIGICLKGTKQNSVDSLAFETLIPKSIVQRYISLLLEHRRIILCGPSGTGKTYLAQKLAEHLVLRSGKELTAGSVATFNVDHKTAKELRQYLANIAEQCENTSMAELPSVIILDNLHHVGSLGEVFNGFLSVKYQKCPYIIGTMNQATCSTTNLQLHHNFRWVLCANHMEPVKGFLGRFLRRRLVEAEVMTSLRNNDLNKIIDWVPKVWLHLNKFLETHSSSDVTIGPRLFLSAPMDIGSCKQWFTDLWNYSIVPYMLEAVREGLQVYGRRAQWEDPSDWVSETFPWSIAKDGEQILLKIRQEDVGYDSIGLSSSENSSPKVVKNKNKEEITVNDSEGDSMISDV